MGKNRKPQSTSYQISQLLKKAADSYTHYKDKIRTLNKERPSKQALTVYTNQISDLLDKIGLEPSIKDAVMLNTKSAKTIEELNRTKQILQVLATHGLHGEAAKHFFLGGHFQLADNGELFSDLKSINGSEVRFSSHFKDTREEELGISAGRILPEVLFIRSKDNEQVFSHFQAEASPWRMPPKPELKDIIPNLQTMQNIEHIYDSIIYFAAKKHAEFTDQPVHNRSNYGWSPYADNNPIKNMSKLPESKTENAEEIDKLLNTINIDRLESESKMEIKPSPHLK